VTTCWDFADLFIARFQIPNLARAGENLLSPGGRFRFTHRDEKNLATNHGSLAATKNRSDWRRVTNFLFEQKAQHRSARRSKSTRRPGFSIDVAGLLEKTNQLDEGHVCQRRPSINSRKSLANGNQNFVLRIPSAETARGDFSRDARNRIAWKGLDGAAVQDR